MIWLGTKLARAGDLGMKLALHLLESKAARDPRRDDLGPAAAKAPVRSERPHFIDGCGGGQARGQTQVHAEREPLRPGGSDGRTRIAPGSQHGCAGDDPIAVSAKDALVDLGA